MLSICIKSFPPTISDVIFPAFSAPYFSPLLFPVAGVAAIGTEWLCYRLFSTNRGYPNIIKIILANLVSWCVGIVIAFCLPSGLITEFSPEGKYPHLEPGPYFTAYVIVAFFFACVLSIIIEYLYLRWSTRKHSVDHLFRLSAIANTAGYLVLIVIVWIWFICFM